jgi:DNA-binding GntR family transcriptional regulator
MLAREQLAEFRRSVILKATNLYEKVYAHLKEQIYSGSFSTGEPVFETQLAEQLGVSRTPVREALRMLENEGLLDQLSGGGVCACRITSRDIQDASDARVALEMLTARLAAERLTEAQARGLFEILERTEAAMKRGLLQQVMVENESFHYHIAVVTGSRLLRHLIDRAYDYIKAHRVLKGIVAQSDVADFFAAIYQEHFSIAEAIRAHDSEQAAQLMREHLTAVSKRYQTSLVWLNRTPIAANESAPERT